MSRRGGITATLDPESLRELEAALGRASQAALEGVRAGVAITAEVIVAKERALVPVDTGRLREGIQARYSTSGLSAQVGVWDPTLYYALFVEWGTTIRTAVPFATPAAEKARGEFGRNITTEVRRRVA